MRVQGAGSATFLMVVVLGAMAVVGVFGLPQFEPVVASPDDVPLDDFHVAPSAYSQAGAGEAATQRTADLFAPLEALAESHSAAADDLFAPLDVDRLENNAAGGRGIVDLIGQPARRPVDESIGAGREMNSLPPQGFDDMRDSVQQTMVREERLPFENEFDRRPAAESASAQPASSTFDNRFGRRRSKQMTSIAAGEGSIRPDRALPLETTETDGGEVRSVPDEKPSTWRAAVGQLNSLGVRDYRLSPGSRPNAFHFSCFFSPADNPRITHRFEAEAAEPLEAVQNVLAQIGQWKQGR